MSRERYIRRSQCISPFGVGAIFDIGDESLVACDITKWKRYAGTPINLNRLQTRLHVREFRMPPVPKGFFDKNPPKLPFYRFPRWLFCPSCREMTYWMNNFMEKPGEPPRCENPTCRKSDVLVPMRFVMVCANGHLDDVDWDWWVHSGSEISTEGRCQNKKLQFKAIRNRGSGLESLEISCKICKRSKSLKGIARADSMKAIGVKCRGKQPWQSAATSFECGETPRVMQRGASNVYYPVVVSALDIPCGTADPESRQLEDEIRAHGMFNEIKKRLASATGDVSRDSVIDAFAKVIAEKVGCDKKDVIRVALDQDAENPEGGDESQRSLTEKELLAEEWPALIEPPTFYKPKDRFVATKATLDESDDSTGILELIDRVILIERLREVRALRGFHRVKPGDDSTMVPVDLGMAYDWLPAIEIFGEGIFIAFSEEAIEEWQNRQQSLLEERTGILSKRLEESFLSFLPEASSRFIMLHTFSHLLMRQLSFECGYSASSLRERIYSALPSEDSGAMAGILIYTADSDSEGALGGLVRQGQPDRLVPTMITALERGRWCSADPICRELPGQGLSGLNRAACHACCLVSETSCVYSNTLLDRMLVLGHDDRHGDLGFFSKVITETVGR